jgi:phosphoketolase
MKTLKMLSEHGLHQGLQCNFSFSSLGLFNTWEVFLGLGVMGDLGANTRWKRGAERLSRPKKWASVVILSFNCLRYGNTREHWGCQIIERRRAINA